ncbi:MAG: glycosyltransferase family 4 protein [Dehalococcoidia bacterium]
MRILIATDSFEPKIDGVSETAAVLVRAFTRRGHDVTVVAPGPGPARMESAPGARIVRLPSAPLPLYREVRVAYRFAALRRAIEVYRPQAAIILTTGSIGLSAARLLPASTRVVHIYTTDMPAYLEAYRAGFLVPSFDAVLRWLARRSVATLCPTEVVREDLARRRIERLEVWGRGVDTTLFRPDRFSAEMRARLAGGEPERPLVLYVGRLAREKRILDLLEATRRLRHARFALVGDGPQRQELERLFPPDRTVFTGFMRGIPLAEAFASADVFAFPSDTDTFAQVVLQAMASGTPPVVAEHTAPAQFVPRDLAGLHAPARSPREFAAAIGHVLDDRVLRARLSQGAVEAAQPRSWDALIERLEVLLTGEPPAPTSPPPRRFVASATTTTETPALESLQR